MFRQGQDFSLRDKRLFEISEVEITRVNCICILLLPCILCAQDICNQYAVIYLPFDCTESKGPTCLIFNASQDKIKSPLHIFEQFPTVFCEFRDSHV